MSADASATREAVIDYYQGMNGHSMGGALCLGGLIHVSRASQG
jgi:hypothetical protein